MTIKELYLKALYLTLIGLISSLLIGNLPKYEITINMTTTLYYIIGGIFATAFSMFSIAYIKIKDNTAKKRSRSRTQTNSRR